MDKKGQMFVLMITIFMGIALFTIFISLNNNYSAARQIDSTIGSSASAVIQTYQKQEAALLYLDLSAHLSLKKSLFELGKKGGLESGECGVSIYNLWNTKTKKCFPDYKESLKKIFKEEFDTKISGFTDLAFATNHELTINLFKNYVEVMGIAPDKITLVVSKGTSQTFTSTNGKQVLYKLSKAIKDNVNRYDDLIQNAARKYQMPPNIIKGQIAVESGGNSQIINFLGCAGLGQFCPTGPLKKYFNNIVDIPNMCQKVNPVKDKNGKTIGYKYHCSPKVFTKDDRFSPSKMIDAEAGYLKELTDRFKNKGYSDFYSFGIGAYNTGAGNIDKAISEAKDLTKKEDPSWNDIAPFLPEETQKYVPKINDYNMQFGGLDISLGQGYSGGFDSVVGTLEFSQNFKVKEDYSLSLYDKLITFAKKTITDCQNDVNNCLNKEISGFNSKNKEKIFDMKNCEEGATKVLYDFAENVVDCGDTTSENCVCKITEDYDTTTAKSLENFYWIKLNKFKFGNEASKDPDYINPTYWVNDWEDMLDSSFEDDINRMINSLEQKTGVELGVMVTPFVKSIDTDAKGLYDYWGVGKKDEKNGILLLASVKNKKIDIYVGEGLSKIITPQDITNIKNNLRSKLSKDKIESGILEAVDTIIKIIRKKYEEDFIKTSEDVFDINMLSSGIQKDIKAKTYHVPWFKNYAFSYKDGLLENTHINFVKKDGKVDTQKNFQDLYLYKGKKDFSLVYKKDGKFYNESHEELTEPINYCDSAKKIYRLCADTGKKILVFEDDKLQSKSSKIKFALSLIDTVAPNKAENLKVEWLTDLDKLLLTWDEKTSVDMASYYEVYFDEKSFTTIKSDLWLKTAFKKTDITNDKTYNRLRKGAAGNPPPGPVVPIVNQVLNNQNQFETGRLYYDDSSTGREYYLLIDKDSFITTKNPAPPNLKYYFAVVGADASKNKDINNVVVKKIAHTKINTATPII